MEKIKNLKIFQNFNKDAHLKISQKEKIWFFDSLYNLIESWIPIMNSLNIMLLQTKNKKLKYIIQSSLKEMWKWKKLQACFEKYPLIFSNFDIYIIKMWEVTGKVPSSLKILKDESQKNADLRSKVIWALIYPIIIVLLSIAMIVWFMLFVIPKVEDMYKDAQANLPPLTQKVIDISHFLQENYLLVWLITLIIILGLTLLKRNNKIQYILDKNSLNFPIFWGILRKKILIIYANTLWTLLKNWILINEALEITKKTIWNKYYEKEIENIIEWIWEWKSLSLLMWIDKIQDSKPNPFFPIELISIIKIWEQTWKLADLLEKIWNKFWRELDTLIKNLSTAIEPIVILIVWSIVWTMILAILLPFFNMVNVMK